MLTLVTGIQARYNITFTQFLCFEHNKHLLKNIKQIIIVYDCGSVYWVYVTTTTKQKQDCMSVGYTYLPVTSPIKISSSYITQHKEN